MFDRNLKDILIKRAEKYNFSGISILILVLSYVVSNIIAEQAGVLLLLQLVLILFCLYHNIFIRVFVKNTQRFVILLGFAALFSYLSNSEIIFILKNVVKVWNLLIVGILFNYFADIIKMTETVDYLIYSNFPKKISHPFRKFSYAFFTGIRFVPEILETGGNIKKENDEKEVDNNKNIVKKLNSYTKLFKPLFLVCFEKAEEIDKDHNSGFDDKIEKRKLKISFTEIIAIIFAISLNILIYIL